jgi:hypothetical protein
MKPGSLTINGIHFEYGDNGEQRYYDCVMPNGDYVVVVQPYHRRIAPHTLWWAAHIWRGDRVCGLADSTEDYDGEFLILTDSVVDVHSPHTRGRIGVLMGGSATERANSNNRQHKMGGSTTNYIKPQKTSELGEFIVCDPL